MATATSIEWTRGADGTPGATWNPLLGCTRVSPGCDLCYAIRTTTVRAGNPHPAVAAAFAGLTERRGGRLDWTGTVNLLPARLTQPLRWRKPRKIFVNSLSDLFHDQVPDHFVAQIFAVMLAAGRHTFQVLTKRHARMASLLSRTSFARQVLDLAVDEHDFVRPSGHDWWPLPNVWLGVSVEDQKRADLRIPALLRTPATVRWLSCEPLLGSIDLLRAVVPMGDERGHGLTASYVHAGGCCDRFHGIDWVVAGGESGPGARPMHPRWPETLRDQCTAAGIPFLLKQWGEYGLLPRDQRDLGVAVANDGTVYQPGELAWPHSPRLGEALRAGHERADLTAMYRVGKTFAGRELDGQVWDEYPPAVKA